MNSKKNKRIDLVIIIYFIFILYLFVILTFLLPALDDYFKSPVVENNSYTLTIPTQIRDDNITAFLSFRTGSPAFWTKEAIDIEVELTVPFQNKSYNYRVRFPYSSYADRGENYIEYDSVPEPYIDLVEAEGPSFYFHGKTTIAYHIRGYFDVVIEERSDDKTVIDSVILENVIEVSSHTDRLSYNMSRIQLAMSIILFAISIILFYHQISEIKKRIIKKDTINSENNIIEKKSTLSEVSHLKEDNNQMYRQNNEDREQKT